MAELKVVQEGSPELKGANIVLVDLEKLRPRQRYVGIGYDADNKLRYHPLRRITVRDFLEVTRLQREISNASDETRMQATLDFVLYMLPTVSEDDLELPLLPRLLEEINQMILGGEAPKNVGTAVETPAQ